MKKKFIYKQVASFFNAPCQYVLSDDYESTEDIHDLLEKHYPNYCWKHCGQPEWKCWRKAFKALAKHNTM